MCQRTCTYRWVRITERGWAAVCDIYRDGPGEESSGRSHKNQEWYPYQKKWYLSHFAHIPKEVHTMCSRNNSRTHTQLTGTSRPPQDRARRSNTCTWPMPTMPMQNFQTNKCNRCVFSAAGASRHVAVAPRAAHGARTTPTVFHISRYGSPAGIKWAGTEIKKLYGYQIL